MYQILVQYSSLGAYYWYVAAWYYLVDKSQVMDDLVALVALAIKVQKSMIVVQNFAVYFGGLGWIHIFDPSYHKSCFNGGWFSVMDDWTTWFWGLFSIFLKFLYIRFSLFSRDNLGENWVWLLWSDLSRSEYFLNWIVEEFLPCLPRSQKFSKCTAWSYLKRSMKLFAILD